MRNKYPLIAFGMAFVVCFVLAMAGYGLLTLLPRCCPGEAAFGSLPRMFTYHTQHFPSFIALAALCYALVVSIWVRFVRPWIVGRGWQCFSAFLVIVISLILIAPLAGMLWECYDMAAGFVPSFWFSKLMEGAVWGLSTGWIVLVLSIPFNICGLILGFFVTDAFGRMFDSREAPLKGERELIKKRKRLTSAVDGGEGKSV